MRHSAFKVNIVVGVGAFGGEKEEEIGRTDLRMEEGMRMEEGKRK